MPLKASFQALRENKKGLSYRLNLLYLFAGKEGHISNFSPTDLEAILNFLDRYKIEIDAVKGSFESLKILNL